MQIMRVLDARDISRVKFNQISYTGNVLQRYHDKSHVYLRKQQQSVLS